MTGPRLISFKQVQERTTLSASTIWRKQQAGEFPQAINLGGRRKAFVEKEIDNWIAQAINDNREMRNAARAVQK